MQKNNKPPLSIDEKEYQEFAKWLSEKPDGFSGFTLGQAEFAKQMFEFLVDYPSFRKKMVNSPDTRDVFFKIQQFLKAKAK